MLAVFTDVSKVPELGSLRSLRHNFIDIAGGLDAIIVHVGSSYAAEDQDKRQGTDNINLAIYPSAWWRDEIWWKERGKAHSVKTTSERMTVALEKSGLRTELSDEQVPFSAFGDPGVLVPANGEAAGLVTISFSGYNKTTLTWDEATGRYSKGEFGKPQLDLATGEPLQFTNALILLMSITSFDGGILRQIDLSSGKGFYVSAGKAEPISWKKGGTNDPFYFTTVTGEQLVMNTGKTYIALSRSATFRRSFITAFSCSYNPAWYKFPKSFDSDTRNALYHSSYPPLLVFQKLIRQPPVPLSQQR